MAVTILETLENAYFNLVEQKIPGISDKIGANQLKNAINLLEKNYSIYEQIEPLIEKWGSVENVPEAPFVPAPPIVDK